MSKLAPRGVVDMAGIEPVGGGTQQTEAKSTRAPAPDPKEKLAFQALLYEAQRRMLSAWTEDAPGSQAPFNLFSEYRLIMNQALDRETPPRTAPSITNPKIAAQLYEVEASRSLLNAVESTQAAGFTSLPALAMTLGAAQNIPGSLFQNLIHAESGFDPNALGAGGAMGLGQLKPDTARDLGLRVGADREPGSVWHPESNLKATAEQLKSFYDLFVDRGVDAGEAWNFASGAYKAGVGPIDRALGQLGSARGTTWDELARTLSRIDGPLAQEIGDYVNRLR